jgi:hypothetical protein
MKKFVILLLFFIAQNTYAQNIVQVEYFIDIDPGFGNGEQISVSPGTDLTVNFTAALTGLDPGIHIIYVRAQDENGNWSIPVERIFEVTLIPESPSNITAVKYYFEKDGEENETFTFENFSPADNIGVNFTASLAGIEAGTYNLHLYGETETGVKSLEYVHEFELTDPYLYNFTLTEISSLQSSTIQSTLEATELALINVIVSGELEGELDFNTLKKVQIKDGPFSGSGFIEGSWTATLQSAQYKGDWKTRIFYDMSTNEIVLKGTVGGEIRGVCSGILKESTPGSGIFDHYYSSWSLLRVGEQNLSATVSLQGDITNEGTPVEYSQVSVKVDQVDMTGRSESNDYTGPLSAIVTRLFIDDESNPYFGMGISTISYNSSRGSGEGWTIDMFESQPNIWQMRGKFEGPLSGMLNGIFDKNRSPNILNGFYEPLDLYLSPQPELKIDIWGPINVSSGQTTNDIIELRNDGPISAQDITLVYLPPFLVDVNWVTPQGSYDDVIHIVRWDFENVPPRSSRYLNIQTTTLWEIPQGEQLISEISLYSKEEADEIFNHASPGLTGEVKRLLAITKKGLLTGTIGVLPIPVGIDHLPEAAKVALVALAHRYWKHALSCNKNVKYWFEIWQLMIAITDGHSLKDEGWTSTDGRVIFDPGIELELGEIIFTFRQEYNYVPIEEDCGIPTRSKTSTIDDVHDPNIKYGPEGNISPEQTLIYEIEYENEGEGIAFGVYITDELDEDIDENTLVINNGGIYNSATRTITWFIGQVDPHQEGSVTFNAAMRGDAPPGTDIINYATVYFPSVPEITRTNGVVSVYPANQPPVASAGEDQTIECTSPVGTQATLDGSGSNDPDNDALIFTWSEDGNTIAGPTTDPTTVVTLSLGSHTIELLVDDGNGLTSTDEVTIEVVDTTPPVITLSDPLVFWPPNHKYKKVDITEHVISIEDLCDDGIDMSNVFIYSVSSDEPENFLEDDGNDIEEGDGNTLDDIIIDDSNCKTVRLRNERHGGRNGRVYTIRVAIRDMNGNLGSSEFLVTIPHDSASTGIDDGPEYMVESTCAILLAKSLENDQSLLNENLMQPALPEVYALKQNYPNPFNPDTEIHFQLPEDANVMIKVFNTLGQEVNTLTNQYFSAGYHRVIWNGRDKNGASVPSGIYFYTMETGEYNEVKKMILIR